jgi:hypothetical protein
VAKKKGKFDLTHLVQVGCIKEGETLSFVSDPTKTCRVMRQPNGEYKVSIGNEVLTVHAFAQRCLGQDPPDHASHWVRTGSGTTLYAFWQQSETAEAA